MVYDIIKQKVKSESSKNFRFTVTSTSEKCSSMCHPKFCVLILQTFVLQAVFFILLKME